MSIYFENISENECTSSKYEITSADSNLTIEPYDNSTSNRLSYIIPKILPDAKYGPIKVKLTYGDITEPFVDTGVNIRIINPDLNGDSSKDQEWVDYIPLRFFRGLIPITISAKSVMENNSALNGFIIFPDGNSRFFSVPDDESMVLLVPTFGLNEQYLLAFSGATVSKELSKSSVMLYTVSPGSSAVKQVDTDDDMLLSYMKNGGNNHSEEKAVEVDEAFEAYLSDGEVDYWSVKAESNEIFTPGKTKYCTVSFSSEYQTEESLPSSFFIQEGNYIREQQISPVSSKGMTFLGWFDKISNKKVEEGTYIYSDTELYAKWELTVYPIEYELNGGKNDSNNPRSYTIADDLFTLKFPSKNGYKFAGWYATEDWEGDAVTTVAGGEIGAVTLYAKWIVDEYKIEYEFNGGTNSPANPAKYTIESDITFAEPIRTGYKFSGWYESEDFRSERVETIEKGTNWRNIKLYAKWEIINYKITYELNSGSFSDGDLAKTSYTIEDSFELTEPVRNGCKFLGWFTDEACKENKVTSVTAGENGDKKFYAKWEIITYTVTYVLNGGTNNSLNKESYTVEDNVWLTEPEKTGYEFAGWYETEDFTDSRLFWYLAGTTGNKTLYAKWEIAHYPVTYELDGGTNDSENPASYTMLNAAITLKNPSRKGWTFSGWYKTVDDNETEVTTIAGGETGAITLYAKWELAEYSITYELNGGTNNTANPASYTIESSTIIFAEPTRTGYDFKGWYETSNYSGDAITTIPAESTGNRTLYAKWQLTAYPITYVLNGGENGNNPATYTMADNSITLNVPSKTGYNFLGWYKTGNFTGTEVTAIGGGETGAITLYAKWELAEYSISYELNGGTNSASNPAVYTIESSTIIFAEPTRTGYDFMGWYGASDYSGDAITSIPAESTGNRTLYAKWQIITYTVEYTLNGGTNSANNPVSYNVASNQISLAAANKNGYDFMGWFTTSSFTGDAVEAVGGGETGNKHFYAKYQPKEYSINYVLNGGTNSTSNPAGYTIESSTITFAEPARTGYGFIGWYATPDFSGAKITSIPAGSTGVVTLYARWKNTGFTVTVAPYSDISVTKTESGTTLTFTASEDYSNYKWYIDNVAQTVTGNTLEFETSSLNAGVYSIYLEASKNGRYYSSTINVTVGGNN